ncbi:MAG: hypothetical protein J7K22_00790 [Nanoarchaeota archaeon]|nr:hypothetical protein [Nanoarchaeota archaeon]
MEVPWYRHSSREDVPDGIDKKVFISKGAMEKLLAYAKNCKDNGEYYEIYTYMIHDFRLGGDWWIANNVKIPRQLSKTLETDILNLNAQDEFSKSLVSKEIILGWAHSHSTLRYEYLVPSGKDRKNMEMIVKEIARRHEFTTIEDMFKVETKEIPNFKVRVCYGDNEKIDFEPEQVLELVRRSVGALVYEKQNPATKPFKILSNPKHLIEDALKHEKKLKRLIRMMRASAGYRRVIDILTGKKDCDSKAYFLGSEYTVVGYNLIVNVFGEYRGYIIEEKYSDKDENPWISDVKEVEVEVVDIEKDVEFNEDEIIEEIKQKVRFYKGDKGDSKVVDEKILELNIRKVM